MIEMKVILGSTNKAKQKAVEAVFTHSIITTMSAPSGVRKQPLSDEETRQGAINRATYVGKHHDHCFGIGLEGGVMFIDEALYLCNWATVYTPSKKHYTAAGGRFALPNDFAAPLKNGVELSELMNDFTKRNDIRHHEGAVGIFTQGAIDRSELFVHVLQLLKGQLIFHGEISN